MDYETMDYEDDARVPDGWTVAVWPDGKALCCSPRTGVEELGGRAVALDSVDDAIETAVELAERL